METRTSRRGGQQSTSVFHCVRSNGPFRASVKAIAAELGVSESALFRSGLVALVMAHPDVSDEHKKALTKASTRIRSWFIDIPVGGSAVPLSHPG